MRPQFKQHSNVIAEGMRFHGRAAVASLVSMSDTITSYVGATSTTFPFVTIPDFDRRGESARRDAYVEVVGFSPLVVYEDRHRWSLFSTYSSDWMGPNATGMSSDIYRLDDDSGDFIEDDNILMVPVWMTSPAPHNASVVNFNIISDSTYDYLFYSMIESQHTALSAVYMNTHIHDNVLVHEEEESDDHEDEDGHDADHDHHEEHAGHSVPRSVLMTPVYDSFDLKNRSVAGVIHGSLSWKTYLADLLPPGVNGILVVLKNSCGQSFTFRIDGPVATFISEGDLHDEKYDDIAEEIEFGIESAPQPLQIPIAVLYRDIPQELQNIEFLEIQLIPLRNKILRKL